MTATAPAKNTDDPDFAARLRAWLGTVDLARVIGLSLFASVFVIAGALWSTFGPLAGALGLFVPFAAWYTAIVKIKDKNEAHERSLRLSAERARGTLTRPALPTRAALDEGGTVKAPQWEPAEGGGF